VKDLQELQQRQNKTKLASRMKELERKYQDVLTNLTQRYIANVKKSSDVEPVTEDDLNEIKQDISAFRYEVVELLRSQNGEERTSPINSQRRTLKNSRRIGDGTTRKHESSLAQKLEKDRSHGGKNMGPHGAKVPPGQKPAHSPDGKRTGPNQLTPGGGNAPGSAMSANSAMNLFVQKPEPPKPTAATSNPNVSMLPTIMTTKPTTESGGSVVLTQDPKNPEVFNANPIWGNERVVAEPPATKSEAPKPEEGVTKPKTAAPVVSTIAIDEADKKKSAPPPVVKPKEAVTKEPPTKKEDEKKENADKPKPPMPGTESSKQSAKSSDSVSETSEKASSTPSETGSLTSNDVAPLIPDSKPTTPTRELSGYFRRASISVPDEPVITNQNYHEDNGFKFVVRGKKKFHPIKLSGSSETISGERPSDVIN